MAKADLKAASAIANLNWSQYGIWAFLAGAIVAVVVAIGSAAAQAWATNAWFAFVLVAVGLVVGFLNITKEETHGVLMAAVALVVVNTANLSAINTLVPFVGTFLEAFVKNAIVLVAPAALVIALKSLYSALKG